MKLGEAKKKALALMAEYSVDGVLIPDGENADYLNRMNYFASDAQMEISQKIPIISTLNIDIQSTSIPLPEDFKEFLGIKLNGSPFNSFRIQNQSLIVPEWTEGYLDLIYTRNPAELNIRTPDEYVFEVASHVHYLIPYYMGGMALQDENEDVANRLLNMYFSRLETVKTQSIEVPRIEITYGI